MSPDKPVHAANVPTDRPRRQVPRDEIAARAERLWHERNHPSGQDDAIWLEAESQLQAEAEMQPVAGTPSWPDANEPAKNLRSQTKSRDSADAAAQTPPAPDKKAKPTAGKLRNQ